MSAKVQLYVYDLSGGMARSLSAAFLGHQIDGVWHSSIVVRGIEHYYGGGINVAPAGTTPFGHPVEVIDLGETFLEEDIIESLLVDLSKQYTPEKYSLFDYNCNNFSDELAQLLTGNRIPSHITGLPATVLATPFGQMLRPMLAGLEAQMKKMRTHAFRPHTAAAAPPQALIENGETSASGAAEPVKSAEKEEEEEASALMAAEKEIETAVAECAIVDMEQRLEELDLKEGRGTPLQQLGEEGAFRLAAEAAVKREYEKIMAEGGKDEKEAEALAVERVAAGEKFKAGSPMGSPRHHHARRHSQ